MTVGKSVIAWVADAEATYTPTFDAWFPAEFAWREFCADVPEMSARLGEKGSAPSTAAAKARLEETAQAAFRGAHIAALALLAGYDATVSPDDALARLCAPPTADEEDVTAGRTAADLGLLELRMVGKSGAEEPSERVLRASKAARAVREPVRDLLASGLAKAADTLVGLGESPAPMAKVLAGVVNVAIALAGLRYAVAVEVDRAQGNDVLHLDLAALRSAIGGDDD